MRCILSVAQNFSPAARCSLKANSMSTTTMLECSARRVDAALVARNDQNAPVPAELTYKQAIRIGVLASLSKFKSPLRKPARQPLLLCYGLPIEPVPLKARSNFL